MDQDEFMMALAEGGFQVGELAKYYYPDGRDIKTVDFNEALAKTNKLLHNENVTIYEAAIQFDKFIIRVDVLKKQGNEIELIEVKAKSYDNYESFFAKKGGYIAKPWRSYLYDVAFQTMVTQHAFPDWEITPYLMLADKNKTTSVNGLNQLFIVEKGKNGYTSVKTNPKITSDLLGDNILTAVNVQEIVNQIWVGDDIDPRKKTIEEQKEFIARATEYAEHLFDNKKYNITIGAKCKKCQFRNDNDPDPLKKSGFEECWKSVYQNFDVNTPHIFDIWNFRSGKMLDRSIYTQDELYSDSNASKLLNPRQLLQVEKTINNSVEEDIIPDLFTEMKSWKYPLHFIDFETSMMAIPFTKGRKPYEQTAFQFSCHTLFEDGTVKHDEWISKERGVFPNYEFVKELKDVLDKDDGTIFKYSNHENTVLRQVQRQMESEPNSDDFAELITWIDTITNWKDENKIRHAGDRDMIDLLKCVKQYYYHPAMKGSNSIKAVLPAIFSTSAFIEKRYSQPVGFGHNLSEKELWKIDPKTNTPYAPYKLLPNIFDDLDLTMDELFLENGEIQDGGAAMVAFGKMQFTEMSDTERNALSNALLQYCELDTLAMVMIYEHWKSLE